MKTLVSIAAVMMTFVSSANAYTAAADPDLIIMAGRAERQIQAELAWLDKFGMATKPGKVYEILDRHYGPVNKLIRMRYIHPDVLVRGAIDTPLERAATWHRTDKSSIVYARRAKYAK